MARTVSARFFGANLSPRTQHVFDAAPMPQWRPRPGGGWILRSALEDLAPGEILVPSLAIADGEPYGFRFILETRDGCVPLPGFGDCSEASAPTAGAPAAGTPAAGTPAASKLVSTHIDYFGIIEPLEGAAMLFELESETAPQERPMLLGISRRALRLDPATPAELTTPLLDIPALSQCEASAEIAMRVCSPTCVTMVLRSFGVPAVLDDVCRRAFDEPSRMYGVWPQNLHAAGRDRVIGAVRTFESVEEAAALTALGVPVVASVRYAKGELGGGALEATQGHLVVICGFDGEQVIVNDPATKATGDVRRSYDLREFGRIWLRERGAGYVMARA